MAGRRTYGGGPSLRRSPDRALASPSWVLRALTGRCYRPATHRSCGGGPGGRCRGGTVNEALVLLVLVWAGSLVPGVLRSRNAAPHATVGGFERAMYVLRSDARDGSGGRQVLVPGDAGRIVQRPGLIGEPVTPHRSRCSNPVIVRRLTWFRRGLVATGMTLVIALFAGGWFWLPFLVTLGLTSIYVAVLRHLKLQRDEARRVVSDLYIDVAAEEQHVAVEPGDWVGSGTVRLRRWND
jgi:hypothetical protein